MNLRLGIVGGGQLGMYMSQAATRLGIDTCVLTEEADAPAASFAWFSRQIRKFCTAG